MKTIRTYVDKSELLEQTAHLTGWALALDGKPMTISVTDKAGKPVEATVRTLSRPDVCRAVLGNDSQPDSGFDVKFSCDMAQSYRVTFVTATGRVVIPVSPAQLQKETGRRLVPLRKMVGMTSPAMVADDAKYLLKKGPAALKERWIRRYETTENKYMRWLEEHRKEWQPTAAMKQWMSRSAAENAKLPASAAAPKVSIVVPLYNTPMKFYRQMIDCVMAQQYVNWQLCLADGSSDGVDRQSCLPQDERIRYTRLTENLGISGNTNAAISLADGEWIALMDHDDIIEPSALAEMMERAIRTGADMIYSDEDKVSLDLKHYYEPHFKSDYNPDLLRSNNYICHLLLFKRSLLLQVGGFRSEFDGAQDYDFILRLCETAENIQHLPRMLYHWRMHPLSTAENPDSKTYAFEAGRRAIEEHLKRVGIQGSVERTQRPGYYRVRYGLQGDVLSRPKVSIIIPNKDETETLRTCINSILTRTSWPEYEIIVVENNSTTQEIRDYYQELEAVPCVKVITWPDAFNYSAINNFGVSHSSGQYVVLLNNDTEIITPDWLQEMMGICSRPEVGVVGAKLFYPDETIQHAGVVMKLAGCCGHVFYGAEKEDPGSYARASIIQNFSAVTAACFMCRRQVWDRLGGLSTEFQVAYNDIDFCLRAREAGYLVSFTPYAQAYHYESKTRGYEEGSEKQARFQREQKLLKDRFPAYQEQGDPYYNPHLTLIAPDFAGKYLHDGQ